MRKLIIIFSIFFAISSFAEKKTVCSVTLNSSEEIELFKANLSPKNFNFTELTLVKSKSTAKKSTDENSEDEDSSDDSSANQDWLMESCRQGIKCDILVVSGHFGGTFFGKSGLKLPMEDLEKASCEKMCSGILKNPKEVFLFGCNTLAGKEKDSRTPEQYAQVLMNDGFSHEEAQQIAAFRYSPLGSSFNDRMKRTFTDVPRIYGFTSIGPSGKTAFPMLQKYLKQTAPNYSEYISKATPANNVPLLSAFKNTAIAQSSGDKNGNTAVCYLGSDKVSTADKLTYINEVATKGGALQIATHMVNFFEKIKSSTLSDAEKSIFEKIKHNENGKKQILSFTQEAIPGLIKPQIDILNLAYKLEWTDKENYNNLLSAIALKPLYGTDAFTVEEKDQLCSIGVHVSEIKTKSIKNEYWTNPNFVIALGCLSVSSPEAIDIVRGIYYKKSTNSDYSSAALSFFKNVRLPGAQMNEFINFHLQNSALLKQYGVAERLPEIISFNDYNDLTLAKKAYDLMVNTKDGDFKSSLFDIYITLVSKNNEAMGTATKFAFSNSNTMLHFSNLLTKPFQKTILSNQETKALILSYLYDKSNQDRIEKVFYFAIQSKINLINEAPQLMNLLQDNNTKSTVKFLILNYINENNVFNESVKSNLLEFYKKNNSFQITRLIAQIFSQKISTQEYIQLYQIETRALNKSILANYKTDDSMKFDRAQYKKELLDYYKKLPTSEINRQKSELNSTYEGDYKMRHYGVIMDVTVNDLAAYYDKDEPTVNILDALNLESTSILTDIKTSIAFDVSDEQSCSFLVKSYDGEGCVDVEKTQNGYYFVGSRSRWAISLFTILDHNPKTSTINFKLETSDLEEKIDKLITAKNPQYDSFFQEHYLIIRDLKKIDKTKYKVDLDYACETRHCDNAVLNGEAIIDLKINLKGETSAEVISAKTLKMTPASEE